MNYEQAEVMRMQEILDELIERGELQELDELTKRRLATDMARGSTLGEVWVKEEGYLY